MGARHLSGDRQRTADADRPIAASAGAGAVDVLTSCPKRSAALVRLLRSNGVAAAAVDAGRLSARIRGGTSVAAVIGGEVLESAAGRSLLRAVGRQPAWSDYPFVIVPRRRGRIGIGLADALPNAVLVSRPLRREALLSATSSAVRARRRQWEVAAAGDCRPAVAADADGMRCRRAGALTPYLSRVSAMGEMASALAHEVNQPLSAITNYVAGCQRLLATAAASGAPADLRPLFGALAIAEAETMRAGEIVRRMRESVAVAAGPRRPTCLADIVDQACRIARADEPSAGIDVRVAPSMAVVVDCVAIQHVIVSLVRNFHDGVRGDGRDRVVIAACPGEPGFVELRVSDRRPAGDSAAGADPFSAVGFHREDEVRIRLAICRTIIEAHGGAIRTTGTGAEACVAFTLPLAACPSA